MYRRRLLAYHQTRRMKEIRLAEDPACRDIPLRGKLNFTFGLLWVSAAFFASSIILNRGFVSFKANPMLGPSVDTLISLGALQAELVQEGQLWRLFSSTLLHAGFIHIILNAVLWLQIGVVIEPDWGFWRTTLVWSIAAITGSLLSASLDPYSVSVGASGGIFGIMAAFIPYVCEYWHTIPQPKVVLGVSVVSLVLGLACGFMPFVDNYAHMGGTIGGILAGFLTLTKLDIATSRPDRESHITRRRVFSQIGLGPGLLPSDAVVSKQEEPRLGGPQELEQPGEPRLGEPRLGDPQQPEEQQPDNIVDVKATPKAPLGDTYNDLEKSLKVTGVELFSLQPEKQQELHRALAAHKERVDQALVSNMIPNDFVTKIRPNRLNDQDQGEQREESDSPKRGLPLDFAAAVRKQRTTLRSVQKLTSAPGHSALINNNVSSGNAFQKELQEAMAKRKAQREEAIHSAPYPFDSDYSDTSLSADEDDTCSTNLIKKTWCRDTLLTSENPGIVNGATTSPTARRPSLVQSLLGTAPRTIEESLGYGRRCSRITLRQTRREKVYDHYHWWGGWLWLTRLTSLLLLIIIWCFLGTLILSKPSWFVAPGQVVHSAKPKRQLLSTSAFASTSEWEEALTKFNIQKKSMGRLKF